MSKTQDCGSYKSVSEGKNSKSVSLDTDFVQSTVSKENKYDHRVIVNAWFCVSVAQMCLLHKSVAHILNLKFSSHLTLSVPWK